MLTYTRNNSVNCLFVCKTFKLMDIWKLRSGILISTLQVALSVWDFEWDLDIWILENGVLDERGKTIAGGFVWPWRETLSAMFSNVPSDRFVWPCVRPFPPLVSSVSDPARGGFVWPWHETLSATVSDVPNHHPSRHLVAPRPE